MNLVRFISLAVELGDINRGGTSALSAFLITGLSLLGPNFVDNFIF